MRKIVLAAMLGLAVTSGPAGAFSLPKLFQGQPTVAQQPSAQERPVILAQSDPVRMQQIQEEMRQLNGRIEEMSYQLLQMQEQLRKTQEDNEFRFQDLEKKKRSDLGDTTGQPAVAANRGNTGPGASSGASGPSDDVARIIDQPPAGNPGPSAPSGRGAPAPTTLGSIDFDQAGKPRAATRNQTNNSAGLPGVDTGARGGSSQDQQQTASLGRESDSYKIAYDHVLSGDYPLAEKEFTSYLAAYPKSTRAGDASFWLGEAQYSQGKFTDSAKTFLNAHQSYGKSAKAPEMLLKLGMSLAALDNRDTACATLREVPKRYPNAPKAVLGKATSEQKRLAC